MADINTVPLGQAGTGAAYILGNSRAFANWMAQGQRNRQVNSINRKNQQDYNDNLSKSYAENQFKGVPGQLWNAELQSKIDEHAKQGAQYLAQGVDIYNPNYRDKNQVAAAQTYMQDRAMLNNMINAQKQFQKDSDEQDKLYKGDPYSFTPESLKGIQEFEKGTTLYDAVKKGVKYPTLEKVFDYNKNVTEQIPALTTEVDEIVGNERIQRKDPNIPAITGFATQLLTTGPNRNWLEKQIGGPVDGLLKTTDESAVRKAIDAELRSPSSLNLMAELKNSGKVPGYGTPEYTRFLDDAVKEQLDAEKKYDKILSNAVQDGIAKANPSYKKQPDFSLEDEARKRRAEQRAIEDQNRQRVRFSERNKKDQNESVLYRTNLVDGMINGVDGTGETLKGIVSGMSEYDGDLIIDTKTNPNIIAFQIPDKVVMKTVDGKPKSEISLGRKVFIDKNDSNARSKLNQMINEVTGENIPESKFQSGNAGGKVKVRSSNDKPKSQYKTTISRSELSSRASASGYSIAEYEKLLKDKGVKIQ